MSIKYLTILFLLLINFSVKAQILLNADSSEIATAIKRQGGELIKHRVDKDVATKDHYKKIFFGFTQPLEGNSCLINITVSLTRRNKCSKYYEKYWGKDIADSRIEELGRSFRGLIPVKGALKWIDRDKGFKITLIPIKIRNNKFASVYILKFEPTGTATIVDSSADYFINWKPYLHPKSERAFPAV
jgi:hypothetical protein